MEKTALIYVAICLMAIALYIYVLIDMFKMHRKAKIRHDRLKNALNSIHGIDAVMPRSVQEKIHIPTEEGISALFNRRIISPVERIEYVLIKNAYIQLSEGHRPSFGSPTTRCEGCIFKNIVCTPSPGSVGCYGGWKKETE